MKTDQSLAQLTPEATIGQIINTNEEAGELLASIGVSLSKHEKETLRSVCQQQKWSEVEVLDWVKKHTCHTDENKISQPSDPSLPDITGLPDWTEFLVQEFIKPGQSLLKELSQSFPRVLKIHGNQYPWLKTMEWDFDRFKENLEMYFEFEQKKFFPLIGQLSSTKKINLNYGVVQKLDNSFKIIERDQDRLKRQMKTIRDKGNGFNNPGNACSTLRIQNKNFAILFGKLSKQFQVETDYLVPAIQKELQDQK